MVASATAAYVWEDPGDSIMVQISLDVVERLGEAVQQSLGAGPRGEEIGGLLLGQLSPDGGRRVQIEDFELVPSEHLRGASYTLAPGDREILGAQLAKRRPRQVVGYFRSHTRPGLYLDQDDFAVISHYFADPAQVFLVVRPATDGPATGGFFFWEEGDINRKAPYREFPFDRERLLAGGFSIADRTAVMPAPAAPTPVPIARRHAPGRFRLPHVPWMAVPIIGGMFVLAGLFVSQKNTPKSVPAAVQPVAQHQSVLELEAERAGDTVQLRWDPNLPAIRKADLGVLWITDGAQRQRRDLSSQELAAGTTTYAPASKDLDFQLQVFALTDQTSKSVQWTAPAEVPVPTPAEPVRTAPAPAQTDVARTLPASPQPAPRAPVVSHPKRQQLAKRVTAPLPAPVQVAHASPVEVPPPPSLASPAVRSQPRLTAVLQPSAVKLPPSPDVAVSYEPPHGSMFKRALHRISTLGDGESPDSFVPPSPVHKVSPAGVAEAEGSVDVKVFIDETGYVSKAQLLTKKNDLANASIGAALQWRFKPARKHDRPVASEMVLHFRFGG